MFFENIQTHWFKAFFESPCQILWVFTLLWCVVGSGVWCVVCGVRCVVCGVWCVVCGVWCVVSGEVCAGGFPMPSTALILMVMRWKPWKKHVSPSKNDWTTLENVEKHADPLESKGNALQKCGSHKEPLQNQWKNWKGREAMKDRWIAFENPEICKRVFLDILFLQTACSSSIHNTHRLAFENPEICKRVCWIF